LRDSIPEIATGIVRFHITLADEPGADARALADVVATWVRAVDLGFFADGRISLSEPMEARGRSVVGGVRCERVPSVAFQVLARMVSRFSRVKARVESTNFFREDGHRLAGEGGVAAPALPQSIPFAVEYPNDLHADVRVEIEFRAPLAQAERDALFAAFSIWDVLIEALGEEERWGESVDYETRLLSPAIVEHEVHGYFASYECVYSIVWMGLRLHRRLPIERITME
jgi:hypothetical protein